MPSIRVKETVPEDGEVPEAGSEPTKSEPADQIVHSSPAETAAPEQFPSTKYFAPVSNRKLFLAGGIILLAVLGILVMVLVNDRQDLKKEVSRLSSQAQKPPQDQSLEEAEQLKKEIGQYLELPADEVPTVATVVDANKVKGQSFFTNTQNGDKVLLFAKSGKAILYRPSTKKIVEVAPINLNQNPSQ